MEARRFAVLWALLAGCTPSPVFVMPAPDPGAATMLIGFSASGVTPRISVVRPDKPWLLVAEDYPLDLRVLSYDHPIPDLAEGPLAPLGDPPRCDLLDYQGAATKLLRAQGDIGDGWVKSMAPDNAADAWLYGAELAKCIGTCTTWKETLSLDVPRVIVGLKVAHEEAIGFDFGGGVIRTDGASFQAICAPTPGVLDVTTGTWDGGDTLWIGHRDGRIERLLRSEQRADQPCVVHAATRIPSGQPIAALDVAPPSEAFELFILAAARDSATWMARWDGQRFDHEIMGSPAQFSTQLVRLAAGRAIATADNQEILVIYDDRAERVELPILTTVEGLTAAQSVEAEGPDSAWIGISHLGPCHYTLPRRWVVPSDRSGTFSVDNVVRFPGRTYFTSARIRLHEVPDRGPGCPDSETFPRHGSATTRIQASLLRRLNARQLVVGHAREEDGAANVQSTSIRILTRSGGSP